ncbi:MAG: RNA methyltransferase [Bacteroidota bacterium]
MAERERVREGMRGFFGVGIYQTHSEWNTGSLFRMAQAFGCSFAYTIGKIYERTYFDTSRFARHLPYFHYADFDDFKAHLPMGTQLIGVELDARAQDLRQFWHPEQAVYLLGAEHHGLPPHVLDACDSIVQLPTPFSLNVATMGSIVVYDRFAKMETRQNRRAFFG